MDREQILEEMEKTGWIRTSQEPPKGKCLVLLEKRRLGRNIFTADYSRDVALVGCYFHFDMPPILMWKPTPDTELADVLIEMEKDSEA